MFRRALILALTIASALTTGMLVGSQGAGSSQTASAEIPVVGIANVTFKVTDLSKARAYYGGVLGLPQAFEIKDGAGKIASVFFKINDDQYIEVTPNLKAGELIRQGRVVFESSNLEKLHGLYSARGLNPGAIGRGPDGNPVFRIVDPEGNNLDFLQYVAGSQQSRARGKFLEKSRVSVHLLHAGIMVKNPTNVAFYREKLGFAEGKLPGPRGEYVETPSSDRNTETKYPPLDPDNPTTRDQYVREQYGAVYHVGLEVPDMRATRDLLQKRGGYDDLRVRAHVGNSRRWLVHVFDPDGSRTEMMESSLQDTLPPMTVMRPGPPAAPILPKTPGVLPWPPREN